MSLVLHQNFCTYLDLYSRVMLYTYTLLYPEGCTMKQSEQCQASIIKTGSTKPESTIWTQVRGHYPTLSTQSVSLLYSLKKMWHIIIISMLNSFCLQAHFIIALISSVIYMNPFVLTVTDSATKWRWTWKSCWWLGVTFRSVNIISWTLWYFCARLL